MADDYAPVMTQDDEEEERRRQAAFPPVASTFDVGATPGVKAPAPTPDVSVPPAGPIAKRGAMSEVGAIAPAVVKPRPQWSDYAPPESHGWGKFGHLAAMFSPITNEIFNRLPQQRAEEAYKHATAEYEAPINEERTKAQTALGQAQADEAQARTANLQNPPEKEEEWSTVPNIQGPNGEPIQQEKHSGQMRYGPVTGKPIKAPGDTQEQNKLAFQGVVSKLDAVGLPTGPKDLDKSLDAALKRGAITPEEHSKARAYQAANQTPGTNLTVHIAGAEQAQGFQHNEKKEAETYKRYETAQDAEQRLSRMEASYQKALKGDQQAMLALLTDHIGMTLGLQKGARITKDILHEAAASMPWLEKIESKFDSRGYLSGVTLGPEQMAQMLDLGYEARDRAVTGAQDSSQLYGVQPPPGAAEVFGKRKMGEKPALQKAERKTYLGEDYEKQSDGTWKKVTKPK